MFCGEKRWDEGIRDGRRGKQKDVLGGKMMYWEAKRCTGR